MRKLTTLFLKVLPLLLAMLAFSGLRAQENLIQYTIANDVATANTLEFDLLLLDLDGSQPFEEATVQAGVLVNPACYAGGTVSVAILPGTSTLNSTQIPTSIAWVGSTGIIKLASKAPPGCGGGSIISTDPLSPSRVCRIKLTNTVPWVSCSLANLTFCFTTTPYPTKISYYQASDCVNTPVAVSSANCFSMAANAPLNCAVICDPPLAFAVTGGGSYCAGGVGLPVGLALSETGVTYTLYKDGVALVPTVSGTGAAISFGDQLAGTYTVSGSKVCPDLSVLTTPMTGSAIITETPISTVEQTESACDTYTWAIDGVTYTASGDYTFVVGCVTNILHLTITPSSTVEQTASACDSYTWALDGVTYTASGDYTYVVGCVTNILHLTITPSSTVEFTESACDTYTWALDGVTYTASGDYTYVVGCVTNILHLTITPSSTVEFTESACDSYTWALDGVTYTASGDYTFVVGCVTNILHLTITPTVTPTFTQLGPYTVGDVADALPASSIEGITGTWNPAVISTAVVGSSVYTFTPDAGQCALGTTMTIIVNPVPPCPASTWTGLVDNDWFNAGNWNACVPQDITHITIPAGAPNYPTLTSPATCADITIESGASFIGSEFLTVGNALVKRDFPVPGYHYISSPVQATTFNDAFPLNQSQVFAYLYDELSGNWVNRLYSDPMLVGTGYSVLMNAPQTALFAGQLNSNPVALTLSNMNPSGDVNRVGWNLIGNPFTSAIQWDGIVKGAGVDGAVYVWNGSNYISYAGGPGGLTGGIIPAENGFLVKTAVHGDFVIIPFAARVHSNIPFYKESLTNLLSLRADGNTYSDEAFIHFNDNATAGFDSQLDAYKLMGINAAPQLYSMITGDILNINALPMEGNEVVDMGFKCGVSGTYTVTAAGIESFDATTPVWLEDLKTGAVQNLRSNPVYSFDYATGDTEKRFKLHFKSAVPETSQSGINIYSVLQTVVINNTTGLAGEVTIYDLTGRELIHTSMTSQNETRIPVRTAVGTYLVKVITEKGVASNKVFIR